jgi:hypothetical protein
MMTHEMRVLHIFVTKNYDRVKDKIPVNKQKKTLKLKFKLVRNKSTLTKEC